VISGSVYGFVKISKNLARYKSKKIILLDYQNNHVRTQIARAVKTFRSIAHYARILDNSTKLFSDLSTAKFLDTSTKFP